MPLFKLAIKIYIRTVNIPCLHNIFNHKSAVAGSTCPEPLHVIKTTFLGARAKARVSRENGLLQLQDINFTRLPPPLFMLLIDGVNTL